MSENLSFTSTEIDKEVKIRYDKDGFGSQKATTVINV